MANAGVNLGGRRARLGAILYALLRAEGSLTSSEQIGALVGLVSSQVRRDLAAVLGRTGKRGVGYRPSILAPLLRAALDGSAAGASTVLIDAERARLHARGEPAQIAWQGSREETVAPLIEEAAMLAYKIDLLLGKKDLLK